MQEKIPLGRLGELAGLLELLDGLKDLASAAAHSGFDLVCARDVGLLSDDIELPLAGAVESCASTGPATKAANTAIATKSFIERILRSFPRG